MDLNILIKSGRIHVGSKVKIPIDGNASYCIGERYCERPIWIRDRKKESKMYTDEILNNLQNFVTGIYTGIYSFNSIQMVLEPTPFDVLAYGEEAWEYGTNILDNICNDLFCSPIFNAFCMRIHNWTMFPYTIQVNIQNELTKRKLRVLIPTCWKEIKKTKLEGLYGFYNLKGASINKALLYKQKIYTKKEYRTYGALIPIINIPTDNPKIDISEEDGKFLINLI